MLKSILQKLKFFSKANDKENIKDVLEDLIEENEDVVNEIDDGTKKIFKNVINLSDKCVEDVMIPRADIDAVSVETLLKDLVNFIDKTKHSRIPVYDDNLDKYTSERKRNNPFPMSLDEFLYEYVSIFNKEEIDEITNLINNF